MKTRTITILVILIGSVYFTSAQAQFVIEPPTVNIPPTNAFDKIHTSNGTINAVNYSMPFTIKGTGNATITSNNSTHTVYVNVAVASGKNGLNGTNGSNGTTISPLTCANNSQLHSLTVSGTTGTLHCAVNNSTGTIQTLDTMKNIGKGGKGFYAGNNTNTNFQFKNLTSLRTDLITIDANTTDVRLNSNFKAPSINCGAGSFLQVFTNTTGFTCALDNAGTITTAANIGTSGFGFFKNTSGSTINLRNLTSTTNLITLTQDANNVNLASTFKINSKTCGANSFITTLSNSTDSTCATPTDTDNFLTSINSQTGPAINIVRGQSIESIVNSSNTITINAKTYQNNTASNIGKGGKGFFKDMTGSTINLRNMTSLRTDLITISQNLTDVNLGSTFKSFTKTCPGGQAISSFDNTTGTYSCNAFGSGTITSINGQTGSAINIVRGYSNMTNIGNSSNTITIYDKLNKLLTNGTAQNVTKLVGFNDQARIMGFMDNYTFTKSSYTALPTDDNIYVDTTTGNKTITIPVISTMGNGKVITIKKIDSSKNLVEIVPTTQTIEGFNNFNLTRLDDSIILKNNNTLWHVIKYPQVTIQDYQLRSGSNNWYGAWTNPGIPSLLTAVNNTLYAVPFHVTRPIVASQIEGEITTAGTGSNCRMAIYTDDGHGDPSYKIQGSDVGIVSSDGIQIIKKTFNSNIEILPGYYFLAEECNSGSKRGLSGVLFDTAVSNTINGPSTNATFNVSITVANNINRTLVAGISYIKGGSSPNTNNCVISSVKLGAAAFTKAVNITRNNATSNVCLDSEMWYLKNPTSGAIHVTITPATTTSYDANFGVMSFYHVNQTTTIGNTVTKTASATSSSIGVTASNLGSFTIENLMAYSQTGVSQLPPVSPSDTSAWSVQYAANGGTGSAQYKTNPFVGAGSNLMTWTFSPAPPTHNNQYLDVGMELNSAIGAFAGVQPVLRAIPAGSLSSIIGCPSTMGINDCGTMYSVTTSLGFGLSALPNTFPSGATIQTTTVPEILINVVG